MEAITVKELLAAVHGELLQGDETAQILGVNTDSRTVKAGEVFVPLVGERFDGHDYIEKALSAGAEGCLCARVPETLLPGKFYIKVPDTLLALKDLAAWYRAQFSIPFVQVTGSVGKTTTKEMIASVLGVKFHTLKTAANYNNEIGTPQTLLGLSRAHQAAVIETGMDRAGQIRYLGEMVKPDIAVITNVGDMHIEYLGSRENILKAKCEIFENLRPGGVAILNGDDALLDTVTLPQRIVRCGQSEHCETRISDIVDHGVDGITCTVTTARDTYALTIPAPGEHMAYSASMAVAVGEELGLSREEIVRGVAAYEPTGSRMRVIRLPGGRVLLDDCYNANPQSVTAALEVLGRTDCERRVAVLGDMGELGDFGPAGHREMGALAAALAIDWLVSVGDLGSLIAEAAEEGGMPEDRVFRTADAAGALEVVKGLVGPGDAVLVKASHSVGLERVVEGLVD